eukprot:s5303_g2.t1
MAFSCLRCASTRRPSKKLSPESLLGRLGRRLRRLFGQAQEGAWGVAEVHEKEAEPPLKAPEPSPLPRRKKAPKGDVLKADACVRLTANVSHADVSGTWPRGTGGEKPAANILQFAEAVATASMRIPGDASHAREVRVDVRSGHLLCLIRPGLLPRTMLRHEKYCRWRRWWILDDASARSASGALSARLHQVSTYMPLVGANKDTPLNVSILWPFQRDARAWGRSRERLNSLRDAAAWLERTLSWPLDEAWRVQEAAWKRAHKEDVSGDLEQLCLFPSLRRFRGGGLLPLAVGRQQGRLLDVWPFNEAEIDADDMEWPLPMADLTRRAQEHHQRCKDSVFAAGGSRDR